MNNPNHPVKGSTIKVDPITEIKDINSIKKLLADKPRDYCLFVLGINTNLRASDLLNIKVKNIENIKVGGAIDIKEKKTGKPRKISLNKSVIDAVQALLSSHDYDGKDFLFIGQRGVLTVPSVNRLVKLWCKSINLKGNYGSHTLRKTFGYMQRTKLGTDIPTLMQMFNHSSQKQTLDYLGIQPTDIEEAYLELNL